ncbi:MAG TPA: alpha/beta fold hydrolase [Candidatus Binatia bacterium]|nr:alpha/beta fold hydrolase [Candidatus Binatia bacterium]
MNSRMFSSAAAAAVALHLLATGAVAGLTGAQKCSDGKHKAAGKHVGCLVKTLSAAVPEIPDYSRCDQSLAEAFDKLEAKYGTQCNSSDDAGTIAARNLDLVDDLETLIDPFGAGTPEALGCALGRLNAASRRASCGAKAQSVLIKKNLLARDVSTCESKLSAALAKAEEGGACDGVVTAASIAALIDATFAQVEADISNRTTADFAHVGRFRTAKQTLTFVDDSRPTDENNGFPALPQRTFVTEVWYPAVSTTTGAPLAEGAPFPVLLRAHGLGGFRADSLDLIKHLASHGYIVFSPDFPLSNLNTQGGATLLDLDAQVEDVGFLISQILALSAVSGGFWEGGIDTSKVGVVGHSMGGATVLGGAYHPTFHDSRIDAVVALAPFACIFQESFFDGGGTAPLLIMAGDEDMVTGYTSNQLDVFARANAEKYLMTLAGGTHIGFANDFLNNDALNGDEELACPTLVPEGAERPYLPDFDIPADFLGGAAAGVDTAGSTCEPICPPPPATWMDWDRQTELELAGTLAMFEKVLRGSVSADRLLTDRLDSENADATIAYER